VTGAFDSDGICTISASGDQVTDAAATWVEDTAYNPTTCQERLIVGGLTDTAVTALTDPEDTSATTTSTLDAAASSSDSTAAATSYASAYEKTKWIDPVNITITSMTANLRWPLYGAGGTLSGRINPYEFKYDGWSNSGTPAVKFTSVSGGWSVNAPEKFTNSDFATFIYLTLGLSGWLACGALATNTAHFYHNVTVTGYRSGSRGWAYSDKKDGACANLVHHGQYSGWGWTS
jgi:hypothetical protein